MSTAIREINDGTLAANFNASGRRGIDARRRRFALNPGIYHAMLDPRESGRQEILLPSGLLAFRTTPMVNDDYDNALKNGSNPNARGGQVQEDVTAAHFLANALIRYSEDGMRELPSLTLMDDPLPNEKGNVTKEQFRKSAQGYFAALWPSFADVGHQCPHELKECATCRLWLLVGDDSDNPRLHESILERTSKLEDQDKVNELWGEIVAVETAFLASCETRWAAIVGELADRKTGAPAIAKLGPGEHHIRRNLHAIEPSEAATAAGFGMEVAAGQSEGFEKLAQAMRESGGRGDSTEILKMMIERQNKTDDAISLLANSVKALVDKETKEPV